MKLKFIFLVLFSLLIVNKSFATDQAYEIVRYNGAIYGIFSNTDLRERHYPFEPLIWKWHSDTLTRHKLDAFSHPTWLHRGYLTNWEIRNDSLILKRVRTGHFARPHEVSLDFLFPDRNTENGVFADWFSGRLSLFCVTTWNHRDNIVLTFGISNGKILGKRDRRNPPPAPADTFRSVCLYELQE